jgi:hypothetical protein
MNRTGRQRDAGEEDCTGSHDARRSTKKKKKAATP